MNTGNNLPNYDYTYTTKIRIINITYLYLFRCILMNRLKNCFRRDTTKSIAQLRNTDNCRQVAYKLSLPCMRLYIKHSWCDGATITVNGCEMALNSFTKIKVIINSFLKTNSIAFNSNYSPFQILLTTRYVTTRLALFYIKQKRLSSALGFPMSK